MEGSKLNNTQQDHVPEDTLSTAEREAESDTKTVKWFFIGFFGAILGILIASVYEPSPPASRLLGKSPEYVALYTDSYKAKSRRTQVLEAIGGFVVGLILVLLWFLLSLFR